MRPPSTTGADIYCATPVAHTSIVNTAFREHLKGATARADGMVAMLRCRRLKSSAMTFENGILTSKTPVTSFKRLDDANGVPPLIDPVLAHPPFAIVNTPEQYVQVSNYGCARDAMEI